MSLAAPAAAALAPPLVEVSRLGDALLLRSPAPLGPFARCLGDLLAGHAARTPDRVFLAERPAPDPTIDSTNDWRRITYGEAFESVRALGQALLDRGLSPARPLLLLSDNGVDHALLQLAAMHVGVPAAPVSPAFSLLSRDHKKLREIAALLHPGAVYAESGTAYARALDALALHDIPHLFSRDPRPGGLLVEDLRRTPPRAEAEAAFAAVSPDTIAKVLFTSGSTGAPKGVVNTQRMLCSNQQAIAQLWPLLAARPPVVVDWLPWSHTFGGNHNFNMVLHAGGTLYVDPGKPVPRAIEKTVAALREISPTLYFNVPRGFDLLVHHLEHDEALRARFFADLDLVFYAAAALPQALWTRLEAVARAAGQGKLRLLSAWGSTETSPLATSVHYENDRAGVIGLPAPGTDIKLAPVGHKHEIRVRGPNVTPGFWVRGGTIRPVDLDEDGFLRTGDAARLADETAPARGLVFDGRIAENFKLSSGTWVAVGALRIALLDACAPLLADAVLAGHDRADATALLFPNPAACAAAAGIAPEPPLAALIQMEPVRARFRAALRRHNAANPGSSTRIARALLLADPPSIDRGEITDKGYINQRAVLEHRAELVERLYAGSPDVEILVIEPADSNR